MNLKLPSTLSRQQSAGSTLSPAEGRRLIADS
jgi:hypothetical protein